MAIGIGRPRPRKLGRDGVECDVPRVVVDIEQQEDIGVDRRDDIDGGAYLRIVPAEDVPQQKTGPGPRQLRVENGDTKRLGRRRARDGYRDKAAEEGPSDDIAAVRRARRCPIMSAMRPIARPRMSRLSGMNIQSVIPQTCACGDERTEIST